MPNPKTLAVGVAILTILGMTLALAVPMGPSLTGDDDPENSGVTSAQDDPVDNSTDNDTDDNGTDDNSTDDDGDDDDPEDDDGGGEGDSGSGSDSSCESDSGSGESDCDSDGDDQDGEKNKDDDDGDDGNDGDNGDSGDDDADDQDGEKDKDDGDDGNDGDNGDNGDDDSNGDDGGDGDDGAGDGDDNETNMPATCEENGLVQENTIANEAFGTENESGPISSELHNNEGEFQDAYVIVHEGSCIVATVDNNANGDDGGDGNESDDGSNGDDTASTSTCEESGLVQENTIANEAFGTENESGPISSELHANEDEFQDAYVIVHEGSCIVATVDNNANGDDGGDGNESDDGDGNESDDGSNGDDTASTSTCEESGLVQENTIANEAFGTENESGPISSELHANEDEFQDAYVIVHEGSCIVATVDNNANGDDGGDGDGSEGDDGDGNESDDSNDDSEGDGSDGDEGNDGNETDDGAESGDELGTCETDGAVQENTLANELFGTENEDGPFSSELHMNEGEFQEASVLVHEGSCVIATADNNASGQDSELATSP